MKYYSFHKIWIKKYKKLSKKEQSNISSKCQRFIVDNYDLRARKCKPANTAHCIGRHQRNDQDRSLWLIDLDGEKRGLVRVTESLEFLDILSHSDFYKG